MAAINHDTAVEIADLIQAGHSQRQLAKQFAVSRHTIGQIASGQWFANQRQRQRQAEQRQAKRIGLGESGRCPRCRRMMYQPLDGWPCLACRVAGEG